MKAGTESKLKFMGLKRELSLPFWQVIGILESLWHITLRNAPAGDIGKLTNEEIASAIEWSGDADSLVAALVKSRWLDTDPEFRLIVHNWSVHCPNYLKGGYTKGHKQFADVVAKSRAKLPAIATQLSSQKPDENGSLASSSTGGSHQFNSIQFNSIQEGEAAKLPVCEPEKPKTERFTPPTVSEVRDYCQERKNRIDPEYFIDHYEAKGWMVGKSKMKSWKATIRTWEKNNFEGAQKKTREPERIVNEPIITKFKPVDLADMARP